MTDYESELTRLLDNMRAIIGFPRETPERPLMWECFFGGARMSIHIDASLIQYLHYMTGEITIRSDVFTDLIVERWKLINTLICQRFIQNGSLGNMIDVNYSGALATLAAFPLLEDICMRWTKYWDQSGIVLTPIGSEYNLVNDKGHPRTYKTGTSISSLLDKLKIVRHSFAPDIRELWDSFDTATRRPALEGLPLSLPLFDRLYHRRNAWAHGQEFEGWEAITISLIISFLYLDSCLKNKSPHPEENGLCSPRPAA
jgi:hypothetical protein